MSDIKLLRIDERLIHGQIVTSWINDSKATTILIADNAVVNDELQCGLLEMATPPGVQLKISSVADAISFIKGQDDTCSILLLVKNPMVVNELIELGLVIEKINVGNMGSKSGRVKYSTTLWLTSQEKQAFKELIASGKDVFLQVLPVDNPIKLSQLIK